MEAAVFIDGNNLYHNTRSMGVRPSRIDFGRLVGAVCAHFGAEPKSIYYYNSVPDISDGSERYYRHQRFLSELKGKNGFIVRTRKLQKHSNADAVAKKLRSVESIGFCSKCLELVKRMCSECIGMISKKEKGIDVSIAIDMLNICVIRNECDMCILISGDADFIPVLDIIRSKGKEVASASVYAGYSHNLRQKHRHFVMGHRELDAMLKQVT